MNLMFRMLIFLENRVEHFLKNCEKFEPELFEKKTYLTSLDKYKQVKEHLTDLNLSKEHKVTQQVRKHLHSTHL